MSKKWIFGVGVASLLAIFTGTALKKISNAVEREKLNPPVVEKPLEITKETVSVSNIIINRKNIAEWLNLVEIDHLPRNNYVIVCSGYGCIFKTKAKFSEGLYNEIKEVMDTSTNAENEREALKKVLNIIKNKIGILTGTEKDSPGEPFLGNGSSGQMNNSDETNNTLQYLYILADKGYIRYHHLESPIAGNFFTYMNRIIDKDAGKSYLIGNDKEGKYVIVSGQK